MKNTINKSLTISAITRSNPASKVVFSFALLLAFPAGNMAIASEFESAHLPFYQTVKRAQKNDPWLTGNKHQQSAVESQSRFAGTLADPKISLGFANVAADSFEFDQEAMSQFKVGVTQMFPRGDTRRIKQRLLNIQSEAFPLQRQDRQAKVAVTVGSLWLDLFNVQQSMVLIEQNRSLFEQLVDITQASYSSSRSNTRQQDIVRAQLEVSRIEDKLVQLQQKQNIYRGQLNAWLINEENVDRVLFADERVENVLPEIPLQHPQNTSVSFLQNSQLGFQQAKQKSRREFSLLSHIFSQHPALAAVDKQIKSAAVGIELAQQKYLPEWGVTASYGLRDDDPMGNSRADLFSVGVVFELPLFTKNRQDQEVKATVSKTEAMKTDKELLLRKFYSAYASNLGRLKQLLKRKTLFDEKLMPQFQLQSETTLNAYTHDSGEFSEVVRARIDELNAKIDYLAIKVEQQKLHLSLNYLFVKADVQKTEFQLKTQQGGL